MTGIVNWAAERARMVIAFILISLLVGAFAYASLPKEGEPDIEIPAVFISVPFPGISAEDSETLLVKVMETELSDLDGLKDMSATAAEGYAGVALEFEFGWDKTSIIADIRDAMDTAEAEFPEGSEKYTLTEINFSEFPIVIVNLAGDVPERTMTRVANSLQDDLESLDAVLEAGIAGKRDEMVEVLIDPLRLEAYNVTALELIDVVRNNNQLIATGEVKTAQGAFSVKIPSTFSEVQDIYELPIKTNGDRVVTLGELAEINFTFEDRLGTARFDGEKTIALQIVKRKGFNLIDTVEQVKETVEKSKSKWPPELQHAISVGTSNDQSRTVGSMVSQLEGSVLTAIALVMIVVLSALGSRAALLVGFAIPTSFLLCFALLALMGISISNIVMFGLILAVGMLVDGAIVVVEFADKRIKEGVGPMHAYVEAAQRMFWPIVSSTATTLCAFLPMLFWPGVPGEFMGMLPVTLIFVLSASLVVALIYLPVMGGVSGRMSRSFGHMADHLRAKLPWVVRAAMVPVALWGMFVGVMQMLNPAYILPEGTDTKLALLVGGLLFVIAAFAASVTLAAVERQAPEEEPQSGFKLNGFGWFIKMIVGNPVMPVVTIGVVGVGIMTVFGMFSQNNYGVEFFVKTEPEQATAYVRARGNLSLQEKDEMVRQAETIIASHHAVINVFSFAGNGGLDTDSSGASIASDTVGQVQFEIIPWEDRPKQKESMLNGWFSREITATEYDGDFVIEELKSMASTVPGFEIEIRPLADGPASGKPVHLRIKGDDWETLRAATRLARKTFETTPGLIQTEDTLPLPGIDWEIDVDVARAGRYGADVATVGAMVQLVTRGILLGDMRINNSDEESDIRVRLPEQDRVLSTLDTIKVPTFSGAVPLSNFITRNAVPKLAQIDRINQQRFYDVKADTVDGIQIVQLIPLDENGEPLDQSVMDLGFGHQLTKEQFKKGEPFNLTLTNKRGWFLSLFLDDIIQRYNVPTFAENADPKDAQRRLDDKTATINVAQLNANERIQTLTKWLETNPFDRSITWEWTGDQEEQAESGAFLSKAFAGALALMFVILLTQFNSFYNSLLVLLAVVLSTTGVLIGMMVMQQPFSIIMTGTGIVALAGIVVNNNIVLIDTYQEFSQSMPRLEAIIRTAQARIRPVLLTTITTMAGLAPMMFGVSLDFINGGYTIDSPTALWWKQLATAVVFGLGIATVLTLLITPSFLALRVWVTTYAAQFARLLAALSGGKDSALAQDRILARETENFEATEIIWTDTAKTESPEPEKVSAADGDSPGDSDSATDSDSDSGSGRPLRAAE